MNNASLSFVPRKINGNLSEASQNSRPNSETRFSFDLEIKIVFNLLEKIAYPAILFDSNYQALYWNAKFSALLGIENSHGKKHDLAGSQINIDNPLSSFHHILEGSSQLNVGGKEHCVVIDKLCDNEPHSFSLLTIKENKTRYIEQHEYQERFGLTRKESQILMNLKQGLSPATIAKQTHRSIHTVRAQLASIFRKTHTHSQTELIAKLSN